MSSRDPTLIPLPRDLDTTLQGVKIVSTSLRKFTAYTKARCEFVLTMISRAVAQIPDEWQTGEDISDHTALEFATAVNALLARLGLATDGLPPVNAHISVFLARLNYVNRWLFDGPQGIDDEYRELFLAHQAAPDPLSIH
jgi:hypothetical protein